MSNIEAMYVHIPFCKNICTYCDFTKVFYSNEYEEKYLAALFKEIEIANPNTCKTIYLGGGTPSVLTVDGLEKLLKFVSQYLSDDFIEFTIEVNPETVSEEKVMLFKKYKINRVSIGVQSFNEDILTILGRKHSFEDVKTCVDLLNKYGISNYSFDLIYGINGLTLSHISQDLKYISLMKPKHISYYSLILENHTCLKAKKYQELDEEEVIKQYKFISKSLNKKGFIQYEVSNYARDGYKSEHNLTYWRGKQYYGFGLGASGYIGDIRYTNTKNLTKYMNMNFDRQDEKITNEDLKLEYIMLGLRVSEGISLSKYKSLFNINLEDEKKNEIDKLIRGKLIKIVGDRLLTTDKGMLLLNQVILELI